jgi:hypothetical protein
MEEILQRRFVFMVFGSGEFRFHLFSPEPPRKVSGFLSAEADRRRLTCAAKASVELAVVSCAALDSHCGRYRDTGFARSF